MLPIGIHDRKHIALRCEKPLDDRGRKTSATHATDDMNIAKLLRKLLRYFPCAIRRVVVDNDDLMGNRGKSSTELREKDRQIFRFVECGENEGEHAMTL